MGDSRGKIYTLAILSHLPRCAFKNLFLMNSEDVSPGMTSFKFYIWSSHFTSCSLSALGGQQAYWSPQTYLLL